MIIRARIVVTMDGAPIENGAVAVSANRIVDVGRFDDIKARNAGNTVDLGEQMLLPGLINAHCHFDYTCLRGKIPPQKSFTDWIRAINAEKSELSPKDYIASINDGFEEAKRFGTTAIANLTAFPELIPQIQPPIRTWWFAELIDIRAPERANEFVDSAIESLGRARLAERAVGPRAARVVHGVERSFSAMRRNRTTGTHFTHDTFGRVARRDGDVPRWFGAPLRVLKSIGRSMDDCGNANAAGTCSSARCGESRPTTVDRGAFERIDRRAISICWNDRTQNFTSCTVREVTSILATARFAFEQLRSLGFNICLGTDSLASNESLSLFAEMRAFQKEFPQVSAEEILQMVTVNPARALRYENALGQIRPGFGAIS